MTQRVVFMGSPSFAVPAAQALHTHSNLSLVGIVTQPDQARGRSRQPVPTPVGTWAKTIGVPCFKPNTKKKLTQIVDSLHPDVIVVVAYGRILPAAMTDSYCCINVHGSILPAYRGASPIHAALMHNDAETGVTLIRLNPQMDAGDILSIKRTVITKEDNFETLHDRLAVLGASALLEFFDDKETILAGAVPQNPSEATYCQKLTPEDACLSQTEPVTAQLGRIRAFSPLPGAYVWEAGKRIKILKAEIRAGKLVPIVVKPEGKGAMSYEAYLLGNKPVSFL